MINQTDESHKFGVGKYISQMVTEAQNRSFEFEMIVVTIGVLRIWKPSIRKDGNITYLDIPRTFLQDVEVFHSMTRQYSTAVFCLLSDLFSFSPNDIFHFNNHMHHILMKEIVRNTDVKIIYTIHVSLWKVFFNNDKHEFLSHWKEKDGKNSRIAAIEGESQNCEIADLVICLTKEMADDVLEFYETPNVKVKVVPNGISRYVEKVSWKKVNATRNNVGIGKGTFVFLYVGRLTEQKGIKNVLSAFLHLIKKTNVSIALLIIGEGPLRKTLESMVRKNEIQIIFKGYVPPSKMPLYYNLADALVFPSLNEQSSYVILEAMKYKLPMILSKIKPFQFLKNGKHCLKVSMEENNKDNHNLLVNAMYITLMDLTLRNTIAENAHKLFLKNHDSSAMFDLTYDVFLT